MLPDKAIFGAFGPKNTNSCQNLNMVQDSDDIVLPTFHMSQGISYIRK